MKKLVRICFLGISIIALFGCGHSNGEKTTGINLIDAESIVLEGLSEVSVDFNGSEEVRIKEYLLWSTDFDPEPVNYIYEGGVLTVFAGEIKHAGDIDVYVETVSGSTQNHLTIHYIPAESPSPEVDQVSILVDARLSESVRVENNELFGLYSDLAYLLNNSHLPIDSARNNVEQLQSSLVADVTASRLLLTTAYEKYLNAEIRLHELMAIADVVVTDVNSLYSSTIESVNDIRTNYLVDIAMPIPDLSINWTGEEYSLFEGNESIGSYTGEDWTFQSGFEFMADLRFWVDQVAVR